MNTHTLTGRNSINFYCNKRYMGTVNIVGSDYIACPVWGNKVCFNSLAEARFYIYN